MSLEKFLINLLLFLFIIDVFRKLYFDKKLKKTEKSSTDNPIINEKHIDKEEDNEFENDYRHNNKKIEIIIKYDKILHEKDFILLKNRIENEYNNINIKGEIYPLPKNKRYFINFTYITQIFTCLFLLCPKYLKMGLPILSDETIEFIAKYNYILIIGNFILHFILNKQISQTGAFELFFNDKKIYSKLEMKNLPNINKLKNILKKIQII